MQFVELDQRTDAWFEWRKNGITASESPVIVGLSPYQTPWRLWAEKTGFMERPDLSRNPNVQRGVLLEDAVRERIAQDMCDIIEPACAEWDTDPIFRASFDGLTSSNLPVEIKCPSERVFMDVKDVYKRQAQPLQQALLDLDRAISDSFRPKSDPAHKGWPKFKAKDIGDGFRIPQFAPEHIDDANGRVKLPKIGWIRYRRTRPIAFELSLIHI